MQNYEITDPCRIGCILRSSTSHSESLVLGSYEDIERMWDSGISTNEIIDYVSLVILYFRFPRIVKLK